MNDPAETPAETIERLTALNNQLAQMLKRGSDRLQESARELMAEGWEAGAMYALESEDCTPAVVEYITTFNPYRQPINIFGGEE